MSSVCKAFNFAKSYSITNLSKALLLLALTTASLQLAWGQGAPTFTAGGQQPHEFDGSPAEAVFNGLLYIVYVDHFTHHYSLASSSDGWNFGAGIDSGYGGSGSPAMVAYNGQLYIAFNSGGLIYIMTSNGGSFSAPTAVSWTSPVAPPNQHGTYNTPALVNYNGYLFIAFTGTDSFVYSGQSSDGIHYSNPVQLPSYLATSSPSASNFTVGGTNQLAIIYTTNTVGNHNPVTYLSSGGGGVSTINNTFEIGGDPNGVTFNGAFYVFGRSNYSANNLWVAGTTNGSTYTTAYMYGQSLHNSPTSAVYNGLLCVGFHSNFSSNHLWTYIAPY